MRVLVLLALFAAATAIYPPSCAFIPEWRTTNGGLNRGDNHKLDTILDINLYIGFIELNETIPETPFDCETTIETATKSIEFHTLGHYGGGILSGQAIARDLAYPSTQYVAHLYATFPLPSTLHLVLTAETRLSAVKTAFLDFKLGVGSGEKVSLPIILQAVE